MSNQYSNLLPKTALRLHGWMIQVMKTTMTVMV
jgi:hypothetical protein